MTSKMKLQLVIIAFLKCLILSNQEGAEQVSDEFLNIHCLINIVGTEVT